MTFNELIDIKPNVRLCDMIQLFLLGMDDKIYFDIYDDSSKSDEPILRECRIIDEKLIPYYDCVINYVEETIYVSLSLLDIHIKKEQH